MKTKAKSRLLMGFCLSIVFIFFILSPNIRIAQAQQFTEIREKLSGISEEEREVLKNLFILVQELEEMGKQQEIMVKEVDVTKEEVIQLESKIQNEEIEFLMQRDALRQVLKIYQRNGPGSYFEIILNSDSLTIFLRKLNTLRDLTRNTGKLLDLLENTRNNLAMQKEILSEKLLLLEAKQEKLEKSIVDKSKKIEQKEQYLTSLGDERDYYQGYLEGLQLLWNELNHLFSETTRELTRIIEEGSLPMDTFKTIFTIHGIEASVDEKTFNDIIAENTNLPKMVFNFYPDRIEIEVPEKNLVLAGKFVVVEGHSLKYEIDRGSFYGMPLEDSALEELYKEGYLMVNFKTLVGNNALQSIEMKEGYLELLIKPAFLM